MAKRLASFAKAMGTNGSEIAALRAAEATASQGRSDAELLAFLFACNMDVTKASAKLRGAKSKMDSLGPVTIADVAPFHRAPSKDRKLPDGCLVLLEDMKGGVARDVLGRPIMLSVGMQHGTVEETLKQYLYVTQRAMQYALPNVPPGAACIVIDIVPQEKGAPVSFRFPDKDVRQIFDLQERCFPGALFSSSHFCGLPRFVTWTFRLVKPFMRAETYEAMVLKSSFSHLPTHYIEREQMLPRWGGTRQFDIDEYVEWRAAEEGVDLSALCPRGAGRAFDPKSAANSLAAARAAAAGEEVGGEGAAGVGGAVTAPDFISEAGAVKHGPVSKRGSGRGLFSTIRWKSKLLVLTPEALAYFDGLNASDQANKLARLIPLRGMGGDEETASVARVSGDTTGHSHQFCVSAGGRDYLFAAESAEAADSWVSAIDDVLRAKASPPFGEAPAAEAKGVLEVSKVQVRTAAEVKDAADVDSMKLSPIQVEVVEVE